jgi:hypothetical protein
MNRGISSLRKKTSNYLESLVARLPQTALLFILSLAVAAAGCSKNSSSSAYTQNNYLSNPKSIKNIGTLCVVELYNNTTYPQISDDVTESLCQTLQKKHLFNVSLLKQNDPAWNNFQIHSDSAYTFEQLLATRKMLGVDALLIGTVTAYRPYPHMMLGLTLKLIDLRDGQVPWVVEQVWDTADKATEARIKKYFERQVRSGYSPLGEQLATLSSINFVKFVTYDVVETLQP